MVPVYFCVCALHNATGHTNYIIYDQLAVTAFADFIINCESRYLDVKIQCFVLHKQVS